MDCSCGDEPEHRLRHIAVGVVNVDDDGLLSDVLGALHHLTSYVGGTATTHVGRAECTSLTSLLDQSTTGAPEVQAAVGDRRTVDALGLADFASRDTTQPAATRTHIQTPVGHATQDAVVAVSFPQLSLRVARNQRGQDADSKVAETTKQTKLPLCHCDCANTTIIPSVTE